MNYVYNKQQLNDYLLITLHHRINFEKIKGIVTNIPPTMMTDQFGLAGFLSAYRGIDGNPSISTLNIGEDPISMGFGMNSE